MSEEAKKAEKKKKQLNDQRIADWQWVVGTEQGRRVINELIDYSGFNQGAFRGQSNQTIFNTGMQAVGQHINQTVIEVSPDNYLRLTSERINGR